MLKVSRHNKGNSLDYWKFDTRTAVQGTPHLGMELSPAQQYNCQPFNMSRLLPVLCLLKWSWQWAATHAQSQQHNSLKTLDLNLHVAVQVTAHLGGVLAWAATHAQSQQAQQPQGIHF